jgi:hypothetical protein
MTQADYDELRTVIIGVLDKLNQVEALLHRFQHRGPAQDALASLRAYRVTTRGFLAKLRDVEQKEAAE